MQAYMAFKFQHASLRTIDKEKCKEMITLDAARTVLGFFGLEQLTAI
jgi:hypothetical protein